MKQIIHFEPLRPFTYREYIEVGTRAYNQHYRHLWPDGDTSPYISSSFTHEVLKMEEGNTNAMCYLIKCNTEAIGILKFTLNAALKPYTGMEALYVDKIYLLKEHSGKGIGKKTIQFVLLRAEELGKKIVWLDTMQKGPALSFYLKNGFKVAGESEVRLSTVLPSEKQMYTMVKSIGKEH